MAQVIEIKIQATGAEQAAQVLKAVADSGAQLGKLVVQGSHEASRGFLTLGDTGKRVFEIFTGFSLGNIVAGIASEVKNLAAESYALGLQSMTAERAFRGMTTALGVNADALLSKMKAVSGGLVDQSDVMLASARAMQQGLGGDQLVKLLDLARDKAKLAGKDVSEAFNIMTDAIANNSTRSLKQFGIVLEIDDVMRKYAHTLGTFPEALSAAEKTQAIFNATMADAATKTRSATTALDENLDRLKQNEIRVKQFKTTWGEFWVNTLAEMLKYFDRLNTEMTAVEARQRLQAVGAVDPLRHPPVGAGPVKWDESNILGGPGAMPAAMPSPQPSPDLLKRALAQATHDLALFNAQMVTGSTTAGAFATALAADIAQLAALGSTAPEDVLKLEALRGELMKLIALPFTEAFARRSMALTSSIKADLDATKVAGAQRVLSAEQVIEQELALQVSGAAAEVALLTQKNVAYRRNAADQLTMDKELAAARDKLHAAQAAVEIAAGERAAKDLESQFAIRATNEASAAAVALAAVEEGQAAQLAVVKWGEAQGVLSVQQAAAQTEQIEVATADTRLQIQITSIAQARAALADQLGANLIDQRQFNVKSAALDAAYQGVLVTHDKATQDAKSKAQDAYVAALTRATAQLTSVQLKALDDQITALQKALDTGVKDVTTAEEKKTQIILLESQKRIALFTTDADKLREQALAEVDAYTRAQELRLTADERYLTSYLSLLQKRNDAQQKTADLALQIDAEQKRSQGDVVGFFVDQFALAAAKAGDFYNGVATLAQTTMHTATNAVSDFIVNFATNAKSAAAIWNSLLNSMLRAISDFLATALVKQFAAIAVSALGGTGGIAAILQGLTGTAAASTTTTTTDAAGNVSTSVTQAASFAQNFVTAAQIGAGLKNIYQGILNLPANFAANGFSGALFGIAPEVISGTDVVIAGSQGLSTTAVGTSQAFSAASAALGAVATAVGIFMIAMDGAKTDIGKAIQSATLVAGYALSWATGGWSIPIAFAINWIEDMFGLFDAEAQLTHEQREQRELARTTEIVTPLATGLQNVLDKNKLVDLLIQYTSGYIGGTSLAAVMAVLNTPEGPLTIGTGGGTPEFPGQTISDVDQIIKLLTDHPEYLQMSVQIGVAQDKVVALNQAFHDLVLEAVARIVALQRARATLTTDIPEQMKKLLPDALYQAFMANTMAPLVAQFDALIASGKTLEELKPAFDALQAQIEMLGQAVAVFSQLNDQIAMLSGDLPTLTASAISNATAGMELADKAVKEAKENLLLAISGPDIIAAAQDLQTAVLARYNLEKQMIAGIEAAIGALLESVGKPLMDLQIALATGPLARTGDTGPMADLLASLETLATTSASVTLRLYAVASGIQAIIAAIPAAITGGALTDPSTIFSSIMKMAAPFLAQMMPSPVLDPGLKMTIAQGPGSLYDQAVAAGDFQAALDILKQDVQMIQALGQAAVAGVQQWQKEAIAAEQADLAAKIAAIQEAAAAQLDALNAEKTAIQEAATLQLDALNAQKTAIQEAATAQIDALNAQKTAIQEAATAQMDALRKQKTAIQDAAEAQIDALNVEKSVLQDQLRLVQQWAQVAKSIADYLTQLRLGPQAPPNPLAQFALAQANYDAANAAFRIKQTPETASAVQAAASNLLAAAQLIYTRPSPEYAALFAGVTAQLELVQAAAAALASPEEAMVARLAVIDAKIQAIRDNTAAQVKILDAQLEAVQDATTAQVKAIDAQIKAVQDATTAQVKAIDAQIKAVQDSTAEQVKAVQEASTAHIAAINATAKALILEIQTTLEPILAGLAEQQGELLSQLLGAQEEILVAITGGRPVTEFMAAKAAETVAELKAIKVLLAELLAGTPSVEPPPAQSGIAFVPKTMAYTLHKGEMVLPPAAAEIVRGASGRSGSGDMTPVAITIGDIHVHGDADVKKLGKVIVAEIEQSARRGRLARIAEEARR